MPTTYFVVLLHYDEPDANKALRREIARRFPEAHVRFSDDVYLVRDEVITSTGEVRERLGLDDDRPGFVLRFNEVAGVTWTHVWTWLDAESAESEPAARIRG